ncbi:MAG: LptF/LptG family permease [Thermoguttaceae bacterium]|nr:LptF/LptG family permease [Thermoguttaceae bacterium]
MKILTRYTLSRFLMIFFTVLTALSSGIIVVFISQATIKKGLPLYLAIRLIPSAIPNLLSISMPVSCLMGGTFFYSKMVGSNEIIALKAMGVPPWKAFMPVWIATILLSCIAVLCNDLGYSWGQKEMTRVLVSGTEEMILGKLASDGKFSDPQNNIVLNAREVTKSGELKGVKFTVNDPPVQGEAESGRLGVNFEATPPVLRIELNGLLLDTNGAMVMQREKTVQEIPLDQFALGGGPGHYPPMKEVKNVLARIRAEEEKIRRENAAQTAFALIRGDYTSWQEPSWGERWDREERQKYAYNRANLATPRSFAAGFTCFFFTWVGIPLAVWLNCSDYTTSFFASFLPTLIVYYPLLMFGYSCAKSGIAPPEICWIGNIVLGLIGFWILKKIHKH